MPFNKKRRPEAESDEEAQIAKKAKGEKQGKKTDPAKGTDSEGNAYWEIGNNRRIGSSQFKGTTLVNIREYYTAPDGELRPGKKGISLSLAQYKALLQVIPELNEALRSQGHPVDDPSVAGASGALVKAEEASKPKEKKPNFEETSEEEEDGDDE